MIYPALFLVGFAAGAYFIHRRWARLRIRWYWLRPPHGRRQREDWFGEENTWTPKER
jgi:hypothetical protein